MKNETKIKIAAVSAGFALATLIGTVVLIGLAHPRSTVCGRCIYNCIWYYTIYYCIY